MTVYQNKRKAKCEKPLDFPGARGKSSGATMRYHKSHLRQPHGGFLLAKRAEIEYTMLGNQMKKPRLVW
jgi:hypothetical protein